jgi:hypothetical protein
MLCRVFLYSSPSLSEGLSGDFADWAREMGGGFASLMNA